MKLLLEEGDRVRVLDERSWHAGEIGVVCCVFGHGDIDVSFDRDPISRRSHYNREDVELVDAVTELGNLVR